MNKIISSIAMIAALAIGGLGVIVSAEGRSPDILEYFSDSEGNISIYAYGIDDTVQCRIAGNAYDAIIEGNLYSDAEKYETLFLVDSSTSMTNYSNEIAEFLYDCIDKKKNNEYYSIAAFSDNSMPEYICDFETDRYTLEKSVEDLTYEYKCSYIYDNLNNTLNVMNQSDNDCFKRIVLFTDGCENSTTGVTIDDVISTINNDPIQIFTVTFFNSPKSNYEDLKTVSRLARSSGGEDIRISVNADISGTTDTLFSAAKEISCLNISVNSVVGDGGIKAVELISGGNVITEDIRMPMLEMAEITQETTASEEEPTALETDEKTISYRIIIAVAAAVIAIIVIIVSIIVNAKSSKEKSETTAEPVNSVDNDDTMFISSRSGNTVMMFESNAPSTNDVLILRDIMRAEYTFEVSLSDDIIIGRSSDVSSLVIDYDKSISKRHCRIYVKDNRVYIEDLGSANKSYVNNIEVISPKEIKTSDEIRLGRVKLSVTIKKQ
ncbi:MAG: FHA domain-containing protein [Oscillospiraceae bacterium]|nr:FHA domain-containing protein [Oscillospiraceae bacterium]